MKIDWNRKYTTISVYAIIVVFITVLIVAAAFKFESFTAGMKGLWDILLPVVAGLAIAYILNPITNFFEKKVFRKLFVKATSNRKRRLLRALSVLMTVIVSLGFMLGTIWLVSPAILESIKNVINNVDNYIESIKKTAGEIAGDDAYLNKALSQAVAEIESYFSKFQQWGTENLPNIFEMVKSGVIGIGIGLKNFVIGYIISIYLLYSKDVFIAQSKKILFACFNTQKTLIILSNLRKSHSIFLRSIMAILIDSLIVGIITTISMFIMGMPYPVLIGCIVGVTNLIPFFGPFLGAIPSGLLVLVASENPMKVVWFALFILIMQQIDGNIIMPRIQGESTGIPAIWVLVSITVGGGVFGIMGMLLAVPVFAVIYMFVRTAIEGKLKAKKLPEDTLFYRDDTIDEIEKFIKSK